MSSVSALTAFLRGEEPDAAGRLIADVLAFTDEELERRHDFIQWLFPLPEPSAAVPGSPVLTSADIAALRSSPAAQASLSAAADRMLLFYESTSWWRRASDHNHLRITRIIRSLRLLAGDEAADGFRRKILDLVEASDAPINATSLRYWAAA